jgi:hypothetical protein
MKRLFKSLTLAILLIASLALAAEASTVAFSQTGFVIGSETINEGFTVPVAGQYKAIIWDFDTPGEFDTLLFAITTTSPLGFIDSVDGAGGTAMFTFTAAPGINYSANIAAITGTTGIGLFGAEVSLIPIPPSLLLLGSGLLGLVVMRRRRL